MSAAQGQPPESGTSNEPQPTDSTRADEAAWAIPRLSLDKASSVALPKPLKPGDDVLMRQIFLSQTHGDISAAALQAIDDQDDKLLLGTVLAARYLGHYHRTTVQELRDWLEHYPDLADAPQIHALLLTRLPQGTVPPPPPLSVSFSQSNDTGPLLEDLDPRRHDLARDRLLDRTVLTHVWLGNPAVALHSIAARHGIAPSYAAQLRAEVAQILFAQNQDVDALRVAQAVIRDTAAKDQPSLAFYIAGLAAWRLQRTELARSLFESGADAVNTSPHLHAASAFWASRVSRVLQDEAATIKWLHVAASERLTLHGLLAQRILGMDTGIPPNQEILSQADVDAVAATPQGSRAFALLQIGQVDRAEAELRNLRPNALASPTFARSLLMVTSATGLLDCAAQMATALPDYDDGRRQEHHFTVPRLRPASGFRFDPTLVYALTRLESNFDPNAISSAGARGLMQIMPATARYMTRNALLAPASLHDPSSNLDIGQQYIVHLSRLPGIDNDLLRMLVSYNAGPGNFARWGPDIHDNGDPLLFIEAIPVPETRAFVAHALVYAWIYAARLHLPASSLDELSANEFPRFTPPPQERRMAFQPSPLH